MTTTKERMDRRVERSKLALRRALTALLIEKGFEATSVAEIAERANVGRSTFYTHYADKEDLLLESIDQLKAALLVEQEAARRDRDSADAVLGFSLPMLEHVAGHRALYLALVGRESDALVMRRMYEMLGEVVSEHLAAVLSRTATSPIPRLLITRFVVGSFSSVIGWWMDEAPERIPAEVDAVFRALVLPGLEAAGLG